MESWETRQARKQPELFNSCLSRVGTGTKKMKVRRLMFKRFLAAAVASTTIALAPQLEAETLEYPEKDPLFTLEVPKGWKVNNEPDGPLTIQNADSSVVAVFDSRIKGVKNLASAKEAVALQTKLTAETTGFTDIREIKPVQEMPLNERIAGAGAQYHAKFPGGEPCIYIVAVFAPDGRHYCSMEMSVKARALKGALEKEWHALIDSITAVKDSDE
jgi:hypothetical protein